MTMIGIIRFGRIKRSPACLPDYVERLAGHVERFLDVHGHYRDWRIERVAIAPRIDRDLRLLLQNRDAVPQGLTDLIDGL